MKAKKKASSEKREYRFVPINEIDYPVHVETERFTYNRFWVTENRIVYEQFLNNVRVNYIVHPELKEIFRLTQLITYVESAKGPKMSKSVLLQ